MPKGKCVWSEERKVKHRLAMNRPETKAKLSLTSSGRLSSRKGKTYNEIYGEEKAFVLKQKVSSQFKNKSYEELYGIQKAEELKNLRGLRTKGKTFQELYGEKATEIKQKRIEKLIGRPLTLNHKKSISIALKGKSHNAEWNKKVSEGLKKVGLLISKTVKSRHLNQDYQQKFKLAISGSRNGFYGKKHKPDTISIIALKSRFQFFKFKELNGSLGAQPFYNLKACEYFKKFDEENNTQGRYAVYGNGEYFITQLGYWPDYINFEKKLIMEWDEEAHYNSDGTLKNKDIRRQKEIQELYPDFEFRRIREKQVLIKEEK